MNKTFVTATTIVVGMLGLSSCSQQPAAPAPAAAPPAAAAPEAMPAPADAPAAADANAPQGGGEVLKKP
jgi:hypothetical protein